MTDVTHFFFIFNLVFLKTTPNVNLIFNQYAEHCRDFLSCTAAERLWLVYAIIELMIHYEHEPDVFVIVTMIGY